MSHFVTPYPDIHTWFQIGTLQVNYIRRILGRGVTVEQQRPPPPPCSNRRHPCYSLRPEGGGNVSPLGSVGSSGQACPEHTGATHRP
eukprot:gene7049-biopygen13969